MANILYSDSRILERKIKRNHYIPYRMKKGEKYQEKKKYFNYYWDMCFKVIYITHDNSMDSYCVKADNSTYHLLSSDPDVYDYLLIKDENEIYNQNIINSNKSFTGAEIIYWFYVNNIDLNSKKYCGFSSYLINESNFKLSDTNRYKVIAKTDKNDNYINCMIKKWC